MQITRTDPFTGEINTRELDITDQQLQAWLDGVAIQRAMSHLDADDREFVMTGIMPSSWADTFGEE